MRERMFAVAAVVVCAVGSSAVGAVITWDGNGGVPPDGIFSTAVNWNPNSVPGVGDEAVFAIADTYTVTLDGNAASDVLDVNAGDVSLLSDSATVRTYDVTTGIGELNVNGGTLRVGAAGMPVDMNSGDQMLVGATSGNGEVIVSGAGSRLDGLSGAGAYRVGFNGFEGTLRYEAEAGGTINGALFIGASAIATSQGDLEVFSDADLTIDNGLFVATGTSLAAGTVTVDGLGSTLTQTGAAGIQLGSVSGGAGTIDVQNGGAFTTGTGTIDVFATGTIGATSGVFNALGPVNVDGGTINTAANNFELGTGLTLTATNGGSLNVTGTHEISDGTTYEILSGSQLMTTGFLDVGVFGNGDGTLVVDGVGSSVATTGLSFWGRDGDSGNVTIRNGATGTLGGVLLGANDAAETTGTFSVESGATVTMDFLGIASNGGATGTATVDGAGSTLTQNGATTLTVGHASTGTATLDVQNGGVFTTGTGTTTVNETGTINAGVTSSGTFNANANVDLNGGTINTAGNNFELGMGLTLTATNGGSLNVTGNHEISDGTTYEVLSGSQLTTTSYLDVGVFGNGDGTLVVDGVGSVLDIGTGSFWGNGGDMAKVTIGNGASANIRDVALANDAAAGTTAVFNVESGATVAAGILDIATSGGATTAGTVTVDGVGTTLTQIGASQLVVGHASTGTATVNVQHGGVFTTGTGPTTVNATGTINAGVAGGGTFNAHGPVNVDGGTIHGGSSAGSFHLGSGLTLTATNDAVIDFQGGYNLTDGTTFDIQSGSTFTTASFFDIGDGGGDGTLLVDGPFSTVTTGGTSFWGDGGDTATVSILNAATGTLGNVQLARGTAAGTTGSLSVGMAVATIGDLSIAANGGAMTSGTVNIFDSAMLTMNGASTLVVGHASEGTATINVLRDGNFATGSGPTIVNSTGTVNVGDPNTFDLASFLANGPLDVAGGTINVGGDGLVNFGSLTATGSLKVRDGGTISIGANGGGGGLSAQSDIHVDGGTISIGVNGGFSVNGGTLTAENDGTVSYADSAFILSGATQRYESGSDIIVGGDLNIATVLFGDGTLVVSGAGSSATIGGTLRVADFGDTGIVRVENGATLATDGAVDVASSGELGTVGLVTVEGAGSTLTMNNNAMLSIGGPFGGPGTVDVRDGGSFQSAAITAIVNPSGTVNVGASGGGSFTVAGDTEVVGTVNLMGGTLQSASITMNGGTFDFTGGLLDVDVFFGDLENRGGTVAPGFSPGIMTLIGGYVNDTAATLEIEILSAGGVAGNHHDLLDITGEATLDGTLDVDLLFGFVPTPGDEFLVLATTTGITGEFATVDGAGLLNDDVALVPVYSAMVLTLVTAIAGDVNLDGVVDGLDANIVSGNFLQAGGYADGDANFDGVVDGLDANLISANFLEMNPATAVPEPGSLALVLLGMACLMCRRAKR